MNVSPQMYRPTHLASSARATMPAPCGAEAEVPVKYFVHLLWRAALTYN